MEKKKIMGKKKIITVFDQIKLMSKRQYSTNKIRNILKLSIPYHKLPGCKVIKRLINSRYAKKKSYKINTMIRVYIKECTQASNGFNSSANIAAEVSKIFRTKVSPGYVRRIRRSYSNISNLK
jgi:predicted amidophosphoribosyltransferase